MSALIQLIEARVRDRLHSITSAVAQIELDPDLDDERRKLLQQHQWPGPPRLDAGGAGGVPGCGEGVTIASHEPPRFREGLLSCPAEFSVARSTFLAKT